MRLPLMVASCRRNLLIGSHFHSASFIPQTYQITFTGYFSKASSPVTIGMFSAMA